MISLNNYNLLYDYVNSNYVIHDNDIYFKGKYIAAYLEYADTFEAITNNVNKKKNVFFYYKYIFGR